MTEGKPTPAADAIAFVAMFGLTVAVAWLFQLGLGFGDCNPYPCEGVDLWGPWLVWVVPVGYGILAVSRIVVVWRRPHPERLWPWMLTVGLVAASILATTCFAVLWT